jgi:hypothetical protein
VSIHPSLRAALTPPQLKALVLLGERGPCTAADPPVEMVFRQLKSIGFVDGPSVPRRLWVLTPAGRVALGLPSS